MAKSKKRKKNVAKKRSTSTKSNNINKVDSNIKEHGPFIKFMSKKSSRIILHIITIVVWIMFLEDFFTFQKLERVPNAILSILALVTLVVEWLVVKEAKSIK